MENNSLAFFLINKDIYIYIYIYIYVYMTAEEVTLVKYSRL